MAAAKIAQEDWPCCPICLEQFSNPRELPCDHSFCERCLQSHITTEAAKHTNLRYVKCPVCRNSASPSIKGRPTSEWASLFPANTVLLSVSTTKSKVDRLCDACNAEGNSVPAEGLCLVCKEAMCGDCLKFHRKQKLLKDHTILSVEELVCNPENVMKLAEGFTCSEHHGEDIKYYCEDHTVPCCAICFFQVHKACSKVIDVKELPSLPCESKTEEIIADMKKIEIHLKRFVEINEASVNILETQISRMTTKIRDVRNQINSVLDELEKRVTREGNTIFKEEVIRKQEENHECLSLIHAVRNSHYLFEAVAKYGSNLQKFIMAEKMRSQLHSYCNLVREKYETNRTMTLQVKFAPPIESILSLSLSELGKVTTTASSNILPITYLRTQTKYGQVERVNAIDLKIPIGRNPRYSSVTFLPGDRVMLADNSNKQCILLSSSYQFITSHTLTDNPCNICVLGDQEVAVSMYNQSKIQILSVEGDVIRPVRMITTKYSCNGIAAAGKGEMVVNGCCGNDKSHWSLINRRGDVKCTHRYDSPYYHYNYLALNNTKTRVYVSVDTMNSILCFDMDGTKQFTYSHGSLRGPRGVAVDRYDNIYAAGYWSHNIHQLSPDGSALQVITSGVPKYPWAIYIHTSKDVLVITNGSDERKLYTYPLK